MPRYLLDVTTPARVAAPLFEAPSAAQVVQTARRLEHVGPHGATHGVNPHEVEDLLVMLQAAGAHRVVPQVALTKASDVLAKLHRAQRRTTDPERRETLLRLVTQLRQVVATQLSPLASQRPSPQAAAQLAAIAQAAQAPTKLSTVPAERVASSNNAVLGPVLHTGDEVWAASAALIRGAKQSVQLQTWAYHRRSESARHIMGALAQLQHEQALRRERGEPILPITIDIVRGSQSWGQGPDHKTGGQDQSTLTASLVEDEAKRTQWHHGIFPFAVDPALLRVTFSERTHKQRGAMHNKTLIVDDDIGVMTSANVKGSHHRASNYNAPFHDFGVVIAGDAVRVAMRDDFRAGLSHVQHVADNHNGPTLSLVQIEQGLVRAKAELQVAPLASNIEALIASKVGAVDAAVHSWRDDKKGDVELVAISKAPYEGLYGKAPDSPQRRAMLTAIDGAIASIEINNTNFNADDVIAALKRAMDRGVHVKIVTSEYYNDALYRNRVGANSNREVFNELIRYRAKYRCPGGLSLKWHPDKQVDGQRFKSSHTKVMFIDRQIAIFGSANLDAQSWSYSGEFNFATHDPKVVHDLRESLFQQFWVEGRMKVDMPGKSDASASSLRQSSQASSSVTLHSSSVDDDTTPSAASLSPTLIDTPSDLAHLAGWDAKLFDAKALNDRFKQSLAGSDLAAKDAFMGVFNTDFAPRLRTEEAAIERLVMKHNRMTLSPQTLFAFHIESNVFGADVTDYAPAYRRASTFVSQSTGIRAHLYLPAGDSSDASQRAIIAYEGVTFKPDGIAHNTGVPVGFKAAFDRTGIGHRAFEQDQLQLLAWSRGVLAKGQPLTITGFSMGGTLAARHLAAHTVEERGQIRLLTYAAPGLDKHTAAQLNGTGAGLDARHFRTRHDPVTKAGDEHAPGDVFKLTPRVRFASWFNHTVTTMSNRELNGGIIELHRPTKSTEDQRSPALEWARRLFGRLRLPR